jgi:uncharacterized protein YraI
LLEESKTVKRKIFGAIAALALVAMPALAEAATRGFATANVNMRSGPSTAYPAVVVIPVGMPVIIHGCLSDTPWCDVSFDRGRGWVAGRYVQAEYRQNRVYVEPRYYRDLGVPIISFEAGRYWDQHYRGRDFYRERDRWQRPPPRGGYWNAPPPRRGPNDGRWEEQYGDWNNNNRPRPPRFDNDDRRDPPRWDNDNRRPDRNRDDVRRPDRDRDRDDVRRPDRDGNRDDFRRPDRDGNRDDARQPDRNRDRDDARRPDRDRDRDQVRRPDRDNNDNRRPPQREENRSQGGVTRDGNPCPAGFPGCRPNN